VDYPPHGADVEFIRFFRLGSFGQNAGGRRFARANNLASFGRICTTAVAAPLTWPMVIGRCPALVPPSLNSFDFS
jgi:hypothetical protein